jgi:HEPN domain-containing protein
LTSEKPIPVYRLEIKANFNPIDLNIQFIIEQGWSNSDRIRFHTNLKPVKMKSEVANKLMDAVEPHLLIRRYDRAEDSFISIHIALDSKLLALSNDQEFAHRFLQGLFLECPPAFHSLEELEISEGWVEDTDTFMFFMGLLQGALGWNPLDQIPSAIKASLEEAEKALSIANYRSCVVMCRRTVEALLKFAFQRLLNRAPTDNRGRALKLDDMIREFKQQQPPPIPHHLLHIVDSIRLLGNVPSAHPTEIEDYKFSKVDAEFALANAQYFIDRYFSEIDKEVSKYYTLTIE